MSIRPPGAICAEELDENKKSEVRSALTEKMQSLKEKTSSGSATEEVKTAAKKATQAIVQFLEKFDTEQAILLEQNDQLQLEWAQLLLEQSAWSSPNRLESIASQKLGMSMPEAEEIQLVY